MVYGNGGKWAFNYLQLFHPPIIFAWLYSILNSDLTIVGAHLNVYFAKQFYYTYYFAIQDTRIFRINVKYRKRILDFLRFYWNEKKYL